MQRFRPFPNTTNMLQKTSNTIENLNKRKFVLYKFEKIVTCEQFLLSSQCFKNSSAAEASESVCFREMFNMSLVAAFLDASIAEHMNYVSKKSILT